MLGPNAAGKTTMIQCLTGALPVSSGEILILGQSNRTAAGLAHARASMGMCPQFDILFGALTGREHLLLFAAIKGIPIGLQATEACRLLEQVPPTSLCECFWKPNALIPRKAAICMGCKVVNRGAGSSK